MTHLFLKDLDRESIKREALVFSRSDVDIGACNGPVIGNRIEQKFNEYLAGRGYYVPPKSHCDYPEINTDLKCLQFGGKRGGAAKIHGYSKGRAPTYDLLVMGYTYDREQGLVAVTLVAWVDAIEINWVQAKHFLWSIPDRKLMSYAIEDGAQRDTGTGDGRTD